MRPKSLTAQHGELFYTKAMICRLHLICPTLILFISLQRRGLNTDCKAALTSATSASCCLNTGSRCHMAVWMLFGMLCTPSCTGLNQRLTESVSFNSWMKLLSRFCLTSLTQTHKAIQTLITRKLMSSFHVLAHMQQEILLGQKACTLIHSAGSGWTAPAASFPIWTLSHESRV